jgi:hypothetical protein
MEDGIWKGRAVGGTQRGKGKKKEEFPGTKNQILPGNSCSPDLLSF